MAATKAKQPSRILSEVHEMAKDLHSAGLIDKRRMREFDALCDLDVEDMPPKAIKSLREKVHVSQAVFAAVLNTSISTVQKWEIGDKKPSGPSLKLLNLIERKGLEAVL
jgi:putative transcriptional regulator